MSILKRLIEQIMVHSQTYYYAVMKKNEDNFCKLLKLIKNDFSIEIEVIHFFLESGLFSIMWQGGVSEMDDNLKILLYRVKVTKNSSILII